MTTLNRRCVVLYSGGLDSLLSLVIMKNLGFEAIPLFIKTPFYNKDINSIKEQLEPFGVKLAVKEDFKGYMSMLKNPRFGYGKNLNPCIDCKIFFYKKAKELMEETQASFVVTGEVLGQRPMSQRSYTILRTIEKQSGLSDLVLRPLSAQCLPETKMEQESIVDREKLYCIQGRARKKQLELAKSLGIKNFESPAGGCLLTDVQFSARLKETMNRKEEFYNPKAIELLHIGRHFRIDGFRFVVSRNEDETKELLENFDFLPIVMCLNEPGAVGVFLKEPHMDTIIKGASIVKRYSRKAQSLIFKGSREFIIDIKPMGDEEIIKYRIGGANA